MWICPLALFGFRLRSFEAHARRAFDLTKLDQLSGGSPRQRRRHFIAKVRDRFQVVNRVEKTVEGFAGKNENLVESFVFGVDMRQQCGRGEINSRDATISPASGPARTASVSKREVFLVTLSFTNQIAFERFQTLVVRGEGAMKRYGFVYQFLQLSFGHKQCELRFHVALALAHLLQKSR